MSGGGVKQIFWLGRGFDHFLPHVERSANKALAAHGEKFLISLAKAPRANGDGELDFDKIRQCEVLLPSLEPINKGFFANLGHDSKLKLIFQPAVGYNSINLKDCEEFGVPVCNCPGSNALQTAETTLLLILTALRRIPACNMRNLGRPLGTDLTGKKVCIVGLGNIGSIVKGMLESGFKCKTTVVNSKTSKEEFEKALEMNEIFTINCALNDATRNLFNAEAFKRMRKDAVVVNCARADIVDKEAVKNALRKEEIGFYASDVFWNEPAEENDELLQMKNCFFTPHIGAATVEHLEILGGLLANSLILLENDHDLRKLENRLI